MSLAFEDPRLESIFARLSAGDIDHRADDGDLSELSGTESLARIRQAATEYRQERLAMCRWRRPRSRTNAFDGSTNGPIVIVCNKIDRRTTGEWAGTFAHELAHRTGFMHDGERRNGNECSVPNLIGDTVEVLLGVERREDALCPHLARSIVEEDSCRHSGDGSIACEALRGSNGAHLFAASPSVSEAVTTDPTKQ